MIRRSIAVLVLCCLLWSNLVSAATPTSFCKCTCFNNSTIITLDPSPSSSESISRFLWTRADPKGGGDGKKPQRQGNCNDCNKQFCLDYNLPICKKAMEKDVVTTCFQRDSSKDQVVVFIFIFATIGLLGWALIRPWVDNWIERARERSTYIPVSNDQ